MSPEQPVAVLSNPRAGGGGAEACAEAIVRRLEDAGWSVRLLHATSADQGLSRARELITQGLGTLVVAGGDGMAALGVNACAGTNTSLAIAAVGRGNDFARSIGLPVHAPLRTAQMILTGRAEPFDLGRRVLGGSSGFGVTPPGELAGGMGHDWFAGILATGFDAIVNARANRAKRHLGRLTYTAAVARELPGFTPLPYRLTIDGREREVEGMLVAVGNGSTYGGGLRMCPSSDLHDGLFDIAIVHAMTRREMLTIFPRLFTGGHLGHQRLEMVRAAELGVVIEGARGDLTTFADGEAFGRPPLLIRSVPDAVRLIRPAQ